MRFLIENGRFLGLGILLCFGATFGQTFFFGVFQHPIAQDYGLTAGEFGLIYLLVTVMGALVLSLIGHWIDRVNLTVYIAGLWAALLMSFLLLSVATPIWALIPAMFLVRMTGQGMMIHAAMTSMSRYFDAGRGRAVSVAALGIPLGQAVLPPLAIMLMTDMDWRSVYQLLPLVLIGLSLPLSMLCLTGHSKRHAHWLAAEAAKGDTSESDTSGAADSGANGAVSGLVPDSSGSLRRRDMLRDFRFYRILPSSFAVPFWVTAFFFFPGAVADAMGLTVTEFTEIYWVYAVVAGGVPLIAGSLVDRVGGRRLIFLSPPFIAAAACAALMLDGRVAAASFLACLGLAGGMSVPIINALWAELYGTRYLGEIKATTNALGVLSTALAPALIGAALDSGSGMSIVFLAAIIWVLVAAAALIVPGPGQLFAFGSHRASG